VWTGTGSGRLDAGLLCDLDELDVAFEERVDEVVELDALGFGACGEIVTYTGLQIHGHIESGILAEELAALGTGKVVLVLHRFTLAAH